MNALTAGAALLLAFLLGGSVSNNFIIAALVVCSTTLTLLLQRIWRSRYVGPIRLSLFVENGSERVVYAECDKRFVDVLLSFLVLPLGKIISLADKESRIGSMDELYKSVEALDARSFWTEACKIMLLQPRSAYGLECSNLAVKIDPTDYNRFYTCQRTPCFYGSNGFISLVEKTVCNCGRMMSKKLQLYVTGSSAPRGFVAGVERFIVSDDLHVTPITTSNASSLLERENISERRSLVQKDVDIGLKEVLQLLHRSAISATPLTDCFQQSTETRGLNQERNSLLARANHPGSKEMRVKLVFSKLKREIVYAEAREDFVDFLFSFLTLPLGSVVAQLQGCSSVGSIDNLYSSASSLFIHQIVSRENAAMLMYPKLERMFGCTYQLLEVEEDANAWLSMDVVRDSLLIVNPKSPTVLPSLRGGGFVRPQGVFLVSDSLSVEPFSTSKLDIPCADLGQLMITVRKAEGLDLLKAALTSKTVLNDVFRPILINTFFQ